MHVKRIEIGCRARSRQALTFETLETRTLLAGDPILDGKPLLISEFVADSDASLLTRTRSNSGVPFDGDVQSPDWIEIMNVSGKRLDLGGMHLTDDSADPEKWSFPTDTLIDAGAHLVVFASGENVLNPSLDEQGFLHTNFRLSGDGEYLALTDSAGAVIHEFAPSFAVQRTDVSHATIMEIRSLVDSDSAVEYLVPSDDSLEPGWRLADFADPNLIRVEAQPATPIGFDRVGGPSEVGETIGAELEKRSSIDFGKGSLVVLESAPFTVAGRVAEWSFYSEKERRITPLILKATDADFEIVGVGTARTSDGSGVQVFEFDLHSGSDAVDATGYFFGFKDGDNEVDEAGVVVYGKSNTETIRRYNGPLSGSVQVGQQLSSGKQFGRTYSAQVTTSARLAGPINTNVEAAMAQASSLYARYPFTVDQIDTLQSLTLSVRYEDGFVTYLNGTEIARRNVPDQVGFDSTAMTNRLLTDANRYEEINVSEHIDLLRDGENVLALHGLNDVVGGTDFLLDARLIGVSMQSAANSGFASPPTPGDTNENTFRGYLETTSFSHLRGFYESPLSIELTTPDAPDADIYYTIDGTEPSSENPNAVRYAAPIVVAGTTNLRAASFQAGMLPSASMTHTYIFPDDIAKQDTLQPVVIDNPVWGPLMTDSLLALPTLSIVTAESISVEGEFATSAELIFPDGAEGFQVNAGIEVFGGTAVSFPKRSMRLSFKNIYGPSTFEYDLFDDPDGVAEFDQLLLRPGSHDTPFWSGSQGAGSYIRNRWTNDRQLDMGHPAPRGRFVQLYLNGVYWGQYQLMERPNAAFMASNFGGSKSDYDVLNAGRAIDGDEESWNALLDSLDDGYDAVQQYLDVVNYADYILLQFYGGNTVDWRSESNWMAGRRREPGAGFQFFAWDSDIVLRSGAEADIVNFGGPGFLGTQKGGVQQYPEFRRLLAERAQKYFFDDGLFTDDRLRQQIDAFIEQLQVSVIAETARWGSGIYTPDTWLGAMQWIKDTYAPEDGPSRAATVIQQMRHADLFPLSDRPDFSVDGQLVENIAVGDQLAMSAPEGEIYYTLDGSDPWLNQPTVDYTSLVSETSPARVLVPQDSSFHIDWRNVGFDDSTWITGQNGIGYDTTDELNSLVNLDIQEQMHNVNSTAYLRFPFVADDPGQFESLEFSIRYDDGFVAFLNGVEVARRNAPTGLSWASRARAAHPNIEAIEFERFNLSTSLDLLNEGQNVLAIHALNTEASNVDMLSTPRLKAGVVTEIGAAPTAIRYSEPLTVPENAAVKARTLWGDQWSTLRQATVDTSALPLRVSEVMYHPADPTLAEAAAGFDDGNDFEFIELVNTSAAAIDLSDVQFTQTNVGGQDEGIQFDLGQGAIRQLGPGQRLIVVEDADAIAFRYGGQLPIAGQWVGGLSNNSEQVTLVTSAGVLQQFTYDDQWHPTTDGGGASLEIINLTHPDLGSWNQASSWQPSAIPGGTPGREGAAAVIGDSNGDGVFDSRDLLFAFQSGEYEDDLSDNSTFEEGDWDDDGDFTSTDLVFAFRTGHYRPGGADLLLKDAEANARPKALFSQSQQIVSEDLPRKELPLGHRDQFFDELAKPRLGRELTAADELDL